MSIRVSARLIIVWIVEVGVIDLIEDEAHYETAVKDYQNLQQVLSSLVERVSLSLFTLELAHQMDYQDCKDDRYGNEVVLYVPVERPTKRDLLLIIVGIVLLFDPQVGC